MERTQLEEIFYCNIDEQISLWVNKVSNDIWHDNYAFMDSSASTLEKKKFFLQNLAPKLDKIVAGKCLPDIRDKASNITSLEGDIEQIIHQLRIIVADLRIATPLYIEDYGGSTLKSHVVVILAALSCAVATTLGNLLFWQLGIIVASFSGAFGTAFLLLMLEKYKSKNNWLATLITRKIGLYTAPSVAASAMEPWKQSVVIAASQSVKNAYAELVTIFRVIIECKQASQSNATKDSLQVVQHVFENCIDGFSEVYFCDQKREASEERALDACIKLISDLIQVGIEAKFVESGSKFTSEMEQTFNKLGHIQTGDRVLTVYPGWIYKRHVLAKGKLKKIK